MIVCEQYGHYKDYRSGRCKHCDIPMTSVQKTYPMIPFEEVYKIVEESSHETAFNKAECEALYDILRNLPYQANIIEIGVEFGRSTSVIACIAKEKDFNFTAIDNWSGEFGAQAKQHVLDQKAKYQWNFNLWSGDSLEAAKKHDLAIDLIHIDGDHDYQPVVDDCQAWLPKVKIGGYALFDDYGHDSLPGVFQGVTEYMSENQSQWEFIGRFGNKLGVYKRI